jgi:PAS domain S-box-containing protein
MSGDVQALSTLLLERLPLGVVVLQLQETSDPSTLRVLFANAAASALVGFDVSSSRGARVLDLFPKLGVDQLRQWATVCLQQVPREFSCVMRANGSNFSVRSVPLGDGTAALVFEDAQRVERAEAEANSLARFFDTIVEHVPAKIFLKDASDLTFKHINRAGSELLGLSREQLLGKNDHDFFPKEQADFFVRKDREVLAKRTLEDIPEEPIATVHGPRWLHTRKIGIFSETGEPKYLLGISIDITERKRADELLKASHQQLQRDVVERTLALGREADQRRLAEQALLRTEEQLRHAQKMEAVGKLAGGVAHDFNNLLSIVLSYCDLILQDSGADERIRRIAQEIRGAGVRAADLTRQLLAFSRQQVFQARIVDLNEVLESMRRILEPLLGEDVELTIRAQSGLQSVKADPTQLEQVVMNLAVNARDAMPTGGKLVIETANINLDGDFVAQHLGATVGPHVVLSVRDTGVGMDRDTQSRIFEPFFTTKERSKGTGLGMSTVFGIVKQSGGFISVWSELGQGATFKIYLPAVRGTSISPDESTRQTAQPGGAETILLVEDEERVREVAATMLRRHGYTVLEASRPSEAIALAAARPSAIQLLLTDVVMPEMGGRLLAESVGQIVPDLVVLFMSGYTDDAIVRHGVQESSVAFLQKPFTQESLLKAVHQVLAARRPRHVHS